VIPLSGQNTYHHLGIEQEWKAHQGVLINSGEPHEVRPLRPGPLEYVQITFQLLKASGQPEDTTWSDLAEQLGGRPIDRKSLSRKTWQAVTPDLISAVEALRNRDPLAVMGSLMHLLSLLGKEQTTILPPELLLVDEQVRQNPQQPWTTTALATLCGWSTGYLHRRCRSAYGCPPMERVYRIRLEKARSLLLEGRLNLDAVADLCGFSDAYHFSRRFKQRYGISPGTWRKQFRQSPPEEG